MYLRLLLPDRAQVDQLFDVRMPGCVSLYLATDPADGSGAAQIEFRNLWQEARSQLQADGRTDRDLETMDEQVDELAGDEDFWAHQARSLAVFLNDDGIVEFQLPNDLASAVHVSDRFHLKPLLRALTFPPAAYVLALSQNATRVLEVLPSGDPVPVRVPDLPSDAVDAVGVPSISGRKPHGRVQGGEGQKMRLGQFSRAVDQALRPVLIGREVPLVLAATRSLADIYRQWNTYPGLVGTTIEGNPESLSDGELAARAREVIDEVHAEALREAQALFEQRTGAGRTTTDVADTARAATYGMVDTVFVDLDGSVPGTVDDESGAVTFAPEDDAVAYGVVDEIARRVWQAGGTVLAVRRDDIPGGGDVAAILRWAPHTP